MSRVALSTALALLIVACAGTGPAASPTPGPTGSPGASPSPAPSASQLPSASPSPSPSFRPDEIAHPTGTADLVLQAESGGGLVPADFFITHAPFFSLYGDGTVVFRPTQDMGQPPQATGLPRFVHGRLTEEQVQALLRFALGQGRLLEAREHYGPGPCADCGATTFRLNAAGFSRTVTVEALGMIDESGPDALDRRGLADLAQTLAGFEQRARAGELGEVTLYDPPLYRVVLSAAPGAIGEPAAWPWPDLDPSDFIALDEWRRERAMTRAEVALLTEVPSGGVEAVLVAGADGERWTIGLRPLLPDEVEGAAGNQALASGA